MLNIEVENYDEMNTFMREQKSLFFMNLIMCIQKGWEEKLEIINIANFTLKDSGNTLTITITQKDWYELIHIALYYFEEIEEYEYCVEITNLINDMYE